MSKKSQEIINKKVIKKYSELSKNYRYQVNMEDSTKSNYRFIASKIKNELRDCLKNEMSPLLTILSEEEYNLHVDKIICDMLVYYLYGKTNARTKELLWFCYGELIYENLYENLKNIQNITSKDRTKVIEKIKKKKTIQCVDCGEWFEIESKNTETIRCLKCYKEYRKKYKAQKEQERRERIKMKKCVDSAK